MAKFTLRPPEHITFPIEYFDGEGELRTLKLKLRVFTFVDHGWLYEVGGDGWYDSIRKTGDTGKAVKILAHQVANKEELLALMDGEDDIEEGLKKFIMVSDSALVGILQMLAKLYERSAQQEQKKKRAARRKLLRTGWMWSLFAFCGGATALCLWMILAT